MTLTTGVRSCVADAALRAASVRDSARLRLHSETTSKHLMQRIEFVRREEELPERVTRVTEAGPTR